MRVITCFLLLAACSDAGLQGPSAHHDTTDIQKVSLRGDADAAAAEEFSIRLEKTLCFGSCPSFWVQVDASGHVSYRGAAYVARLGLFEANVSATQAEALRDTLIDEGFLRLRDTYQTTSDGCLNVSTDAPTYTYVLQTAEQTKRVVWYLGCEAPPELGQLQAIEKQIMQATEVGRFLYPTPRQALCEPSSSFAETYVLADDTSLEKTDLGILRFDQNQTWSLTACDGKPLAEGEYTVSSHWDRVLLPPMAATAPVQWPGRDKPQGVALIRRTSLASWLTLTTLDNLEEHQQWAYEGDTCGDAAP